jgi:hypothetical protein
LLTTQKIFSILNITKMKKNLILFIFLNTILFNIPHIAVCQNEHPEDEEWTEYDQQQLEEFLLRNEMIDIDEPESVINPVSIAVVRYTSFADVLVRFDTNHPLFTQNAIKVADASSKANVSFSFGTNGEIVLENLTINKDYEITYTSPTNQTYKVCSFSTEDKLEKTGEVALGTDGYNDILEWLSDPGGEDLISYLSGHPGWHPFEITAFLQDYLYFGRALPDPNPNNPREYPENPFTDPDIPVVQSCLCRPIREQLRVTIRRDDNGYSQINSKNYHHHTVWGGVPPTQFENDGRRWHAYGMQGPSKYMQTWAYSTGCGVGDHSNGFGNRLVQNDGTGEYYLRRAGNFARIRMVYLCVGSELLPENCLCDDPRRVRFSYRHGSEAKVETTKTESNCFWKRRAYALAEDFAYAGFHEGDISLENTEILQGAMVRQTSDCSAKGSWKRSYGLADFAVDVCHLGNAILNIPPLQFDCDPLIDAFAHYLREKVADNSVPIGCGEMANEGQNMLDGTHNMTVNQNKPLSFFILSSATVHVRGKRKFHATARVLSNFAMTVTMKKRSTDFYNDLCCGDAIGVYAHANPEGNTIGNIQWIRANFQEEGIDLSDNIFNQYGTYGYRGGNNLPGCRWDFTFIPASKIVENEAEIELVQWGNVVYYKGELNDFTNNTFRLFNVNGQLVYSKRLDPSSTFILDMGMEAWPSGIYFATIDGQATPTKIVKFD